MYRLSVTTELIKSVGVVLASLIVAGYVGDHTLQHPGRNELRNCWLRLDWLARHVKNGLEPSEWALDKLVADHRLALYDLVAASELDAIVAGQMQVAFAEATFHVWRSNTTPHRNVLPQHHLCDDLLTQAARLLEAANGFDPAAVEQVRSAIACDIASFEAIGAGKAEGRESLRRFYVDGIEASPEAIEAARVLVELLLEEQETTTPHPHKPGLESPNTL